VNLQIEVNSLLAILVHTIDYQTDAVVCIFAATKIEVAVK
jgi:hypothetical protein